MTNFELEKLVETSDEWIRNRTGINQRHIASKNEASSDLSTVVAEQLLKNRGITANRVIMANYYRGHVVRGSRQSVVPPASAQHQRILLLLLGLIIAWSQTTIKLRANKINIGAIAMIDALGRRV